MPVDPVTGRWYPPPSYKRKQQPPSTYNGLSQSDKDALLEQYRGRCGLCGEVLSLTARFPHSTSLEWDHIIPRLQGGPGGQGNMRPVHRYCNVYRGRHPDTPPEEYRARILRRL